jgi:hypothetical protein
MIHKVLHMFFDWDDVLYNKNLYFLHEVFYDKVIGFFLSPFKDNVL